MYGFKSYDYSEFITEFRYELEDEVLSSSDHIVIVRSHKPAFNDYYPIIDWYYIADKIEAEENTGNKALEIVSIGDCLIEMKKWNKTL